MAMPRKRIEGGWQVSHAGENEDPQEQRDHRPGSSADEKETKAAAQQHGRSFEPGSPLFDNHFISHGSPPSGLAAEHSCPPRTVITFPFPLCDAPLYRKCVVSGKSASFRVNP